MIFILASFLVPIFIYFFYSKILQHFSGKRETNKWPLIVGGFLYFIAWYLPSPLIQGNQTAFVTHFIGGGIFTGFFWLYTKKQLQLKLHPFVDLVCLYIIVSTLGVSNELFELFANLAKLTTITGFDTWWDLLANSLGALTFWIIFWLIKIINKK